MEGGDDSNLEGGGDETVQCVGEATKASGGYITRQGDTKAREDRGNWGRRPGAMGVRR